MHPDTLSALRSLIAHAGHNYREAMVLADLLDNQYEPLHSAIQLPDGQGATALADFILQYVQRVPELLAAVSDIAHKAEIQTFMDPLLQVAADYLLSPPELIVAQSPLEALLNEAYLAHRLLEEINDRLLGYWDAPLVPVDMTRSNLIAHELIGEPFANELDQAVLFSAELLLDEHSLERHRLPLLLARQRRRDWSSELAQWPCLSQRLAVDIRLRGG